MDIGRTSGETGSGSSPLVRIAERVPDASFAVARDVQRAASGLFRFGMRCSAAVIDVATSPPWVAGPLGRVEARVDVLAAQGSERRRADVARVGAMFQRAEPLVAAALERVVAVLPVDALLARVDVGALLARIDVDALVSQVDVDALVNRVDLQRLVGEVLAGIELGDLIHDSTTGVVADVRDSVRSGAASADGRLAHVVDRIVRRGRARDAVLPGYALPGAR